MRAVGKFLIKFMLWTLVGALSVAGLVAAVGPAVSSLGTAVDSSPVALPSLQPLSQRSFIYDSKGNLIAQIYSEEDRLLVDLKDIPEKLIAVILATEDRDFFDHKGVDYRGIVRAFVNDVKGGKRQGGSTITQQLVKNTFFENGRKDNVMDKAKEAARALKLEGQMSKQDILSRYLNTIYFGNGAYGVRTAAERYFDKSLKQLNLAEMALIAGLIASPENFDPIDHPVAAKQRRSEVLRALVDVGMITTFDADRYHNEPLPTEVKKDAKYAPNSYFVKALQAWLTDDKNPSAAAKALGADKKQRLFRLYHGGLKITTTLDQSLEATLKASVVAQGLEDPVKLDTEFPIEASATVVDNATGAVLAMYSGGKPFEQRRGFDLATDGFRQPGSQYKTFTLAAALENGYSITDSIQGGRCSFDPPVSPIHWAPSTHGGGVMSLKHAFTQSVNCAFARLQFSLGHGTAGIERVIEMAQRLGLSSKSEPVASTTLGVGGATTREMATAFSAFPADGVLHPAIFATKILDSDGSTLYDSNSHRGIRVLQPEIARSMVEAMQGPIESGTATRARLNDRRPAAGKTGTTNESVDAWFTGYTPQLTASVWVGRVKCANPLNPDCGMNEEGGRTPARIWKAFMDAALADQPILEFTPPDASLWPRQQYITEDGRKIRAPQRWIPPNVTSSTTAAAPTGGTGGATKPKKPKPDTKTPTPTTKQP